ncbi:MAG: hypothetical protein RMJ53_10305 [Chitinophagales bacterium]|nr:hypothetical protein [Chitinophagales bacterium]
MWWLFVAAIRQYHNAPLQKVVVKIDHHKGFRFVEEKDILARIAFVLGDSSLKCKTAEIPLLKIEQDLDAHPFIRKAQVYIDQQQNIVIEVTQERPVLRIINHDGTNCFLTDINTLIPVSNSCPVRLPVVLGQVITQSPERDSAVQYSLFEFINILSRDTFLKAFVDQIWVDENGEVSLIPLCGNHEVKLGLLQDNIQEKLKRLKIFYKDVLPAKGWETYKEINLRYRGQLVCVKNELQADSSFLKPKI